MNSLRGRLITGLLSGLALLAAASGAATYFWARERLQSAFDQHLIERALSLSALIEDEGGHIQIDWLDEENEAQAHLEGIDHFTVWKKDTGQIIAASTNLGGVVLPRFGGSLDEPELRAAVLPGDRAGRCVGIEFMAHRLNRGEDGDEDDARSPARSVGTSSPAVLQMVIAKADTVQPTLATIKWPLAGVGLGCLLAGGLFIWVIVGRGLRPLDQLKAQIQELQDAVSGRRIALEREPAELQLVTSELNRLLERVEKALIRERTLTSNVAHELRTPLAGLLSTLEVTLNRLRSPEEYRESVTECFEITKRMHWLVENLLSITRIEAGAVRLQVRPVVVDSALREWWKPFDARAEERRLQTEWHVDPGARLDTDSEFFRIVVTNLFDNAVSYTPEGGKIRIEADASGNISVANQAVGLGAASTEHLFEPFWRNTEAREGSGAHAGLGLNLCRKIIELLGGRIDARIDEPEQVFVIRLEMA